MSTMNSILSDYLGSSTGRVVRTAVGQVIGCIDLLRSGRTKSGGLPTSSQVTMTQPLVRIT